MADKVRWQKWNPGAVHDQTVRELQANGEIVGKFVESEARRRLDAISKPSNKRAVGYRRFLSRFVLTNRVDVESKAVVIRVGMRKGRGKAGDMRGFYIEVGSRTAPATSFLRRAILDNKKAIMATLAGR